MSSHLSKRTSHKCEKVVAYEVTRDTKFGLTFVFEMRFVSITPIAGSDLIFFRVPNFLLKSNYS